MTTDDHLWPLMPADDFTFADVFFHRRSRSWACTTRMLEPSGGVDGAPPFQAPASQATRQAPSSLATHRRRRGRRASQAGQRTRTPSFFPPLLFTDLPSGGASIWSSCSSGVASKFTAWSSTLAIARSSTRGGARTASTGTSQLLLIATDCATDGLSDHLSDGLSDGL